MKTLLTAASVLGPERRTIEISETMAAVLEKHTKRIAGIVGDDFGLDDYLACLTSEGAFEMSEPVTIRLFHQWALGNFAVGGNPMNDFIEISLPAHIEAAYGRIEIADQLLRLARNATLSTGEREAIARSASTLILSAIQELNRSKVAA